LGLGRSQLGQLFAHLRDFAPQCRYLLLDLGTLLLGFGTLLLGFGTLLLGFGSDRFRLLLGVVRHLTRLFSGVLNQRVDFARAFVEELQPFLEQPRRLRQRPALLPRCWHG
jgi:hypothetical protein